MGCGNSKVENSGQRPPQRRNTNAKGGQKQAGQGDDENDKNNNETNRKTQSNTHSNRTRRSNQKGRRGDDDDDDDYYNSEKKRTKVAVNEKGYKKRIRENLRNACAGTDEKHLEKCMEIFVNNNLEDGGDYSEAVERLRFLQVRTEIRDACMRNHPQVLDKAIKRVEGSPYKRQLMPYLNRAYYLKQHQNELTTFRHDISNMEQSTIAEIRSYKSPPYGVHETMIACYLIIGYPEEHLVDWSDITALMGRYGKDSLIREVQTVDPKSVDKNTALKARNYLGSKNLEEIRITSNGAAAFYVWASQVVGKPESGKKSNTPNTNKQLTNSRTGSQQQNSKPITPVDTGRNAKNQKQQQNTAKQQQQNTTKQQQKTTKR